MNSYKIVGLTLSTFVGNSYETESNMIRFNGKVVTRLFTKYILYLLVKNSYYAIHLFEEDCASFGGRLCRFGNMEIMRATYADILQCTHLPNNELVIPSSFKIEEKSSFDDIRVNVNGKCVFEFSHCGCDESRPCGIVYVNMDLFHNT